MLSSLVLKPPDVKSNQSRPRMPSICRNNISNIGYQGSGKKRQVDTDRVQETNCWKQKSGPGLKKDRIEAKTRSRNKDWLDRQTKRKWEREWKERQRRAGRGTWKQNPMMTTPKEEAAFEERTGREVTEGETKGANEEMDSTAVFPAKHVVSTRSLLLRRRWDEDGEEEGGRRGGGCTRRRGWRYYWRIEQASCSFGDTTCIPSTSIKYTAEERKREREKKKKSTERRKRRRRRETKRASCVITSLDSSSSSFLSLSLFRAWHFFGCYEEVVCLMNPKWIDRFWAALKRDKTTLFSFWVLWFYRSFRVLSLSLSLFIRGHKFSLCFPPVLLSFVHLFAQLACLFFFTSSSCHSSYTQSTSFFDTIYFGKMQSACFKSEYILYLHKYIGQIQEMGVIQLHSLIQSQKQTNRWREVDYCSERNISNSGGKERQEEYDWVP